MSAGLAQLTAVVAFLNLLLGIVVLAQGKKDTLHVSFFLFAFFSALWAGTTYLFQVFSPTVLVFQSQYASGAAAILAALIWTYSFTRARIGRARTALVLVLGALLCSLPFIDGLVIARIRTLPTGGFCFDNGIVFNGYAAVLLLLLGVILYELIRATAHSSGIERLRYAYVLAGISIFAIASIIFGLVLPALNLVCVVPYDVQTSLVWVGFAAYAITRHQLFNVRVIATELFTFSLWLFLLVRFFNQPDFFDGVLLLAVIGIGALLIRSVINEVRRREEVERLNRQLADFLRFGVHELRAPLGGIRGYTAMALEGSFGTLDDKLKRVIKIIHTQIDNLLLLVETFLDANRARSGNLEVVIESSDLQPIIKQSIDAIATAADLKSLELTVDVQVNLSKVSIDPRKFQVILGNLLSNAIKYTQKGKVNVHVKREGSSVRIDVVDTGIGIPADVIPHLFHTFERGTDEAKRMATGSGIGLYLSKKLVDAMHGTIKIESPGPERGTTATVTVPVATAR